MRTGRNLTQSGVPGFSAPRWSNYENGTSQPVLSDLVEISKFFVVDEYSLLHVDLEKYGNLNSKGVYQKNEANSNLKGNGSGNLTEKKYKKSGPLTIAEDQESASIVKVRMPQVITVDSQGDENVIMVPVKARAGYLNGFSDPEFMEKLPAYRLPGLNNGTFRLFEVDGLSMYPTLHGGDLVICSFVDQLGLLRDDRVHVVVTKSGGVVVKRVLNRLKSDGKLILKSDNYKDRDMYPPIVCDPQDIVEVWYATGFISRQMKPPSEMYNRLIDLEGRFTLLEAQAKKSLK